MPSLISQQDLQNRYSQINAVDKKRGFHGDNKPAFLCRALVDLDISVRALNILKYAFEIKLEYIDELRAFNPEDIIAAKNCGKTTKNEIQKLAESVGVIWFKDLYNDEKFEEVRANQHIFEEANKDNQYYITARQELNKKQLELFPEIGQVLNELAAPEKEDLINKKYKEIIQQNSEAYFKGLNELKDENKPALYTFRNNNLDILLVGELAELSEQELKEKGYAEQINQLGLELENLGLTFGLKQLAARQVETEIANEKEEILRLRTEERKKVKKQEHGYN